MHLDSLERVDSPGQRLMSKRCRASSICNDLCTLSDFVPQNAERYNVYQRVWSTDRLVRRSRSASPDALGDGRTGRGALARREARSGRVRLAPQDDTGERSAATNGGSPEGRSRPDGAADGGSKSDWDVSSQELGRHVRSGALAFDRHRGPLNRLSHLPRRTISIRRPRRSRAPDDLGELVGDQRV